MRSTLRRYARLAPVRAVASRAAALRFPGSATYWEQRYSAGGNSGSGSFGRLAQYKATYLNEFVRANEIRSVVEFGCGDGEQLALAHYPKYLGIDPSSTAVKLCLDRFAGDDRLSFLCCDPSAMSRGTGLFTAELALSLDVIYHLVEDEVFDSYMAHLFESATRFVVVYSSNRDAVAAAHVRHRPFTRWVTDHAEEWSLVATEDPPFPFDPEDPSQTSWANFFVFAR